MFTVMNADILIYIAFPATAGKIKVHTDIFTRKFVSAMIFLQTSDNILRCLLFFYQISLKATGPGNIYPIAFKLRYAAGGG